MSSNSIKIVITGAAGLLGQNLIIRLLQQGYRELVAIDKHANNTRLLKSLHPDLHVIEADLANLADSSEAARVIHEANVLILGHAQIGGLEETEFERNNILATERTLKILGQQSDCFIVHISSSVVNSMAKDFYTESKKKQETMVTQSQLQHCILRPTLMFGWFDRKHLGWLSRFMQKMPVFPIPGHGRYLRQPLYVQDFCSIILACIELKPQAKAFNISGLKHIHYIDLIRAVKKALGARSWVMKVPFRLFWLLLKIYAVFDRDPPFTTQQLEALVTPDEFEIIDWPGIFGVQPTDLETALEQTFNDDRYADVVLRF